MLYKALNEAIENIIFYKLYYFKIVPKHKIRTLSTFSHGIF